MGLLYVKMSGFILELADCMIKQGSLYLRASCDADSTSSIIRMPARSHLMLKS